MKQDVRSLTNAQLVEATNQANYNAGFCVGHNDRQNVDTWIEAAANLSAEIMRRLEAAEHVILAMVEIWDGYEMAAALPFALRQEAERLAEEMERKEERAGYTIETGSRIQLGQAKITIEDCTALNHELRAENAELRTRLAQAERLEKALGGLLQMLEQSGYDRDSYGDYYPDIEEAHAALADWQGKEEHQEESYLEPDPFIDEWPEIDYEDDLYK